MGLIFFRQLQPPPASPTSSLNSNPQSTSTVALVLPVAVFSSIAVVACLAALGARWASRHQTRWTQATASKRTKEQHRESDAELLRRFEEISPSQPCGEWWQMVKEELNVHIDSHFVCSICLEEVDPTQKIHALKCNHVFHEPCLEQWLLANRWNCPLCQRPFYQPPDAPGEETA